MTAQTQDPHPGFKLTERISRFVRIFQDPWNHGLPARSRITPAIRWPLYFLPWLILLQLIDPNPIWMALLVSVVGFYGAGYAWVATQARTVYVERKREGAILVAGDSLGEEFVLVNMGTLPVLWAELQDESFLPGYRPDMVVSCGIRASYRWRTEVHCKQRGVFRLGPHQVLLGDPFGLFRLRIRDDRSESLLVYPRVAYLPPIKLPRGIAVGRNRQRRPLGGSLRSTSVRDYLPGDSLRHIHWSTTAHRGILTVTELELEPSGDLWIVLDLNRNRHSGEGERSTLEYSIVLAASLAAELLSGGERRAVGLLAVGQRGAMETMWSKDSTTGEAEEQTILLSPQSGKAQLWQILSALAPVQAGNLELSRILHSSRDVFGRGRTVIVITPAPVRSTSGGVDISQNGNTGDADDQDWIAELVHLQRSGLTSSVLLVTPAEADQSETASAVHNLQAVLAQQGIAVQSLGAGIPLPPALTYRRRRTVMRTTPTGGVVTYDVEEEVG
jgi:uncharacterized protein (DUF58 family)